MRHGGVGHPGEKVAVKFDLAEKVVGRFEAFAAAGGVVHSQVKLIQPKPHLGRDDFPDGPGVLPRSTQAGDDRVGIVAVEGEKLNDILLRGLAVAFGEILVVACGVDQRLPLLACPIRRVEHEVEVDVDEARHIFRALDAAAHPVNRIRDATEHQVMAPVAEIASAPGGAASPSAMTLSASTQVSLVPPPWEEFTTSDPGFKATRVSPPGRTKMSRP